MLRAILLFGLCAQILGVPYTVEQNDDRYMHEHEKQTTERRYDPAEETAAFWNAKAQALLQGRLSQVPITGVAKNVILFLGDGMSIPTLTAARTLLGQRLGQPGEETHLSFEEFPYSGLSKTYCVDSQVADSACSATAYLTGVKTNDGTIGVTAAVKYMDCPAMVNQSNHVFSIARWSQLANKLTGLVTTTRVTHASPAGVYSHTANRDWESDFDVMLNGQDPTVCTDIASQMISGETGQNLNVMLGGGRRKFYTNNTADPEGGFGERLDGIDLHDAWLANKAALNQTAQYVWNRNDLLAVADNTEYLLGLFERDHCKYNLDRDPILDPSLAEMTEAAIKVLSKGTNGYFLFVEGGRIDHAHHSNLAQKSLDETIEFSKAIELAYNLTNRADTLIVVTSDHAHTMSLSGYPARGNPILGLSGTDNDLLGRVTLSYANGPGFISPDVNGVRHNYTEAELADKNSLFPGAVPLFSETHGGDDVGVFAVGPFAHFLTGVYEQNFIPHTMAFASCVGTGAIAC